MKQLMIRIFRRPVLGLELAAASFFINILTLAAPFFFILVFNRYLAVGIDGTLITLSIGMLTAVLFQYIFRSIRTKIAGEIGFQPDEPAARSFFDILSSARLQALGRIKKTSLVQAANSLQVLQAAYSAPNVNAVLDMPFSVLFIGVIFLLDVQLGLAAAIGAFLTLASAWAATAMAGKTVARLQGLSAANQVLAHSAINDPETLRMFGGARFLGSRWAGQTGEIFSLRRFSAHNEDASQSRIIAIGLVTRTLIIALGARQVFLGELSIGALIGISVLSAIPLTMLARFVQTAALLKRAAEAEAVLGRFMMIPREKLSGSAMEHYSGGLAFRDLAFTYSGSKSPLFESLDLSVAPGGIVGVTGYNGSGKSTLARVVAGILEPSRGQVIVDGIALDQVSIEWWRKQVIYLPQEPGFFPATIRENIMAANPGLDNDGLNRVISMTGLRRFLDAHPEGLDLVIDEGGRPLPLGIRRRLALARAMTTDGHLAILDEPAEGLDVEGWKMVNRIIKQFTAHNKTVLLFSGDPRLLVDADTIIDLGKKPVPAMLARSRHPEPSNHAHQTNG